MAKRKSTDLSWNRGLKMGKRSKELIPRVKNWCEHIRISESYGGMLGQMGGVPTMVGISCPHTTGSYEGMNFEWSARDFIIKYCRNCNFHKEHFHKNFGREVIQEYQDFQKAQAEEDKARKVAEQLLDKELEKLIEKGEERAEVSELSILQEIKRLRNTDNKSSALSILIECSKISPEFFNEIAIKALELYLSESTLRNGCLTILGNLASDPQKITSSTFQKALDDYSGDPNEINQIAILAKPFLGKEPSSHFEELFEWLIKGQRYERTPFTSSERSKYNDCNEILHFLAFRDKVSFLGLFKPFLLENDPYVRQIGANVLFSLVEANPAIGQFLYEEIINAFELDETMYNHADGTIQQVLSRLLFAFPEETLKKIREYEIILSDEAKVALWGTFIIYGSNLKEDVGVPNGFREVVSYLIHNFSRAEITIEELRVLAEAIREVCGSFPVESATFLDPILGGLALWMVHISDLLNWKQTDEGKNLNEQQFWEIKSIENNLEAITRELKKAIQEIVKVNPELVFTKIIPMIDSLDSKKIHY